MINRFTNCQSEWEALCRRCGRCCYEKIDFHGVIYYTDLPCEYLDLETRLCRVYPTRQKVRKGCVKLTRTALDKGFLPGDCPYVADIENYSAPRLFDED